MPDRYKKLEETARKVFEDPEYKTEYDKTGAPWEMISYGDRDACMRYALSMAELAEKYRPLLTGKS